MLPTFIVAGAGKSGTTTLWEYFKLHPQICMSKIKEPFFFTREGRSARFDMGLAWYESLFVHRDGIRAVGEITPAYITRQDAPQLMFQTIPQVQLIFLLRNPVDRLYSHYWFQKQGGEQLPDFDEMLKGGHPRLQRMIYNSSYHLHLPRFEAFFPRKQIRVVLNDDLSRRPKDVISDIYQWIGVDPQFIPDQVERYNSARTPRLVWLQRWMEIYGPRIMRVKMPGWLFNLLRNVRYQIWQRNTQEFRYPPLLPEQRRQLLGEFQETIRFVEAYLERPLPDWNRV